MLVSNLAPSLFPKISSSSQLTFPPSISLPTEKEQRHNSVKNRETRQKCIIITTIQQSKPSYKCIVVTSKLKNKPCMLILLKLEAPSGPKGRRINPVTATQKRGRCAGLNASTAVPALSGLVFTAHSRKCIPRTRCRPYAG